ncbi:lysophospholipid acyltransferase family protein [Neptunomonas antarctica]|uniref:KDO2-lipid IV(A) lauroyltransferase n=1 Tax=Neptunomonas antarctica TaxID=619304 RepID=A0A1N7ITS9_9GAMM|nr:lysophospholipid acyltransferase family protein [Neptunomonas antarctica]SIS40505.1 KDO2-lipid IV(A) lauroyltransferase [Neptunomonas antarctica]
MKQVKAYVAIAILGLMSLLSLKLAQRFGGFLGKRFANNQDSDVSRITRINVELCFTDLSADEKSQLVRSSVIQTCKSFSEMGMSWFWSPARLLKTIRKIENASLMADAFKQGSGVIFIAPHLGNWEVLNFYLSERYPLTAMYRPPKLKLLDDLIKKRRARLGTRLAPADASGVRMVMKALRRGEVVGILPDQEPVTGGDFSPFFGHNAYSMKLLAQLVKQTGARVVCGYAERLSDGEGFDLHFIEADQSIYDQDLGTAMAAMNRSVEQCVRAIPEQYQWEYKRFNCQPEGIESPYKKR